MEPRFVFSSKLRRLTVVFALFLGFVGILWASGGLLKLSNMAVRQALDRGDDQLAESRLVTSRRLSGRSGETTFLQARLARHRGDLDQMARLLTAAEQRGYDPRAVRREELLAYAQIGQLNPDLESSLTGWMLEGGAELREVCSAYSNGLAASSRFNEAIDVLNAWQADYPADARPAFRLGRILEHQRRKDDAIGQYRLAKSKDPKYVPAAYSLGRLLLDQRKVDEALEVFQASPGAETSIPIQTSIALCKKAQSHTELAKQMLQRVLEHPINEIVTEYRKLEEPLETLVPAVELGKMESDEGNFQSAKEWLERAIDFNDRDMEARYAHAVALRGLGEKEASDREFEYVKKTRDALSSVNIYWDRITADPKDTDARLLLAKILLEHESVRNGLYWLKSIQQYDDANVEVDRLLREYGDRR